MLNKFSDQFGHRDLETLTSEEILSFLSTLNEGNKQSTKRQRYVMISSFFNFMRTTFDESLPNPCDKPMMKKIFRHKSAVPWTILDKEIVDEIIFKTPSQRNRLLLELMARGGMRVGEVLGKRSINRIFADLSKNVIVGSPLIKQGDHYAPHPG